MKFLSRVSCGFAVAGISLAIMRIVVAQGDAALSRGPVAEYSPVAPASALLAGIAANVRLTEHWLDGKDFASAAEALSGLNVLVDVSRHLSVEPDWADRAKRMRDALAQVSARVKAKDAAASAAALRQFGELVAELRAAPPTGPKAVVKNFRSPPNRTLMKLIDGTYSDVKAARTSADQVDLSYTLAETANILRFMQPDAAWQARSDEFRDNALKVAATAHDMGLQSTRAELKNVYASCEACHAAYKR